MHVALKCLALFLVLVCCQANAGRQDELEGWQRRILEAIEEAEGKADDRADRRDDERRSYSQGLRRDEGASRAAAEARREHGGKVLAVVPANGAYRVRLLKPDGRVITVTVED